MPRVRLLVMRIEDMSRTHPDQKPAHCHTCGRWVGIYPSGQRMLRLNPDAEICCNVCRPPAEHILTPPAAPWDEIKREVAQSVSVKKGQ